MTRKRRSRAAELSRRPWSTRASALLAGEVYGELRVLVPDTGKRQGGKRLALVEDMKTGEKKEVRADNLRNGNTLSCGRIKKARYRELKLAEAAMRETSLKDLGPEIIRLALNDNEYAVDVEGKRYRQTRKARRGECY